MIRNYPKFEIDKKILEKREWREFWIGELFDISSTLSGIDKNKLQLKGDLKIPYITRTNINNGIDCFIPETQDLKYKINKGNVITIGLDTQTAFYQPYKFYTGQNIQLLNQKNLNLFKSLFILPLLKIQMRKFNWGGNGATLKRLRKLKILFPINKNNKPDFEYMENIIKELKKLKIKKYLVFIENELKNLEYKEIPKLNKVEWRDFKIEEIFKVSKGVYLPQKNIIQNGKIPYITAQANNNGIKLFIGNEPNFKGNSITIEKVNLTAFYQPYDFYCSHDVSVIQHNKLNKYNALFIASMIRRQGFKYSYGRQAQMNVVKRETLFCPVKNNQPDFEYMEQFIKNIIIKKYKKYLNYKLI